MLGIANGLTDTA